MRGKPAKRSRPAAQAGAAPPKAKVLKTLDRLLSKAGIASRTEARGIIARGRVKVNGKVVRDPEQWVDAKRDHILLDGQPLRGERKTYILLYKPKGLLTTFRDPEGRETVYKLLTDVGQYVFPVGRLDQDTSGLLLLTNDTDFAERMTNPSFHVPKTYLVKASQVLTDEQLEQLRKGVDLKDGPTRPARVQRLRDSSGRTFFEITITEGRNRQVRRMVEALGAKVLKLVRVAIGPIALGRLPIGQWRRLSQEEVRMLQRAARPQRPPQAEGLPVPPKPPN